jgi:hypothetical protein
MSRLLRVATTRADRKFVFESACCRLDTSLLYAEGVSAISAPRQLTPMKARLPFRRFRPDIVDSTTESAAVLVGSCCRCRDADSLKNSA